MALVQTITPDTLLQSFKDYGRDYFSYEACEALVNLFEECDCGTNTELDIIALDCEFTESDPEWIYSEYSNIDMIAESKDEDGEIDTDKLMDALNYYTYAVELSNGNILYQNF